jgi:hypothetical protein
LQTPGVWAPLVRINTGDLTPGKFFKYVEGSNFEAGIPDAMRGLGMAPWFYECNGDRTVIFIRTPTPTTPKAGILSESGQPSIQKSEADTLQGEIEVPRLAVNFNPDQAGITGLVSYFWLTGYDGKPFYKPVTGSAGTGWLRATPLYYQWSFGDRSSVTATSLGEAYPRISVIAHTYDVRSDKSPFATAQGLYHVSVTAFFQVAFQVSAPGQSLVPNGQWVDFATYGLPPLQANVARDYRVREVRQVLTG